MLAEKNEYLQEAAQSVYVANADELIRQKCCAREEAERHERTLKRNIEKLQEENSSLQKEIISKDAYIAELESKLAQK